MQNPTDPFTILELQKPLHDVNELNNFRLSRDFDNLKL